MASSSGPRGSFRLDPGQWTASGTPRPVGPRAAAIRGRMNPAVVGPARGCHGWRACPGGATDPDEAAG